MAWLPVEKAPLFDDSSDGQILLWFALIFVVGLFSLGAGFGWLLCWALS